MLRGCGNRSPHYCGQSTAPRLHAALGQQPPEPPDLTRGCLPLQCRHTSPWHLSCVCRIATCSSLLKEEDDANTPKDPWGTDFPRDRVPGGRVRASRPADKADRKVPRAGVQLLQL